MARLPIPGGDDGSWGTILNEYLEATHKTDGTHKLGSDLVTENVNTVAESGDSQTLPAPSDSTIHDITLTDNCTITLPAAVAGQSLTVLLRQDGVGNKTVTWVSALWSGGTTSIVTTPANAIDIFVFICIDGTNWFGFISGQDMK